MLLFYVLRSLTAEEICCFFLVFTAHLSIIYPLSAHLTRYYGFHVWHFYIPVISWLILEKETS